MVQLLYFQLPYIHFSETSYTVPLKQKLLKYTTVNSRHLNQDAVPSANLPHIMHKKADKHKYQAVLYLMKI